MTTPQDAEHPASPEAGWFGVLALLLARSYLVMLATLGVAVLIPSGLGWAASVVQSESMAPNVSTGDVVLAAALPTTSAIPVGGVVTFRIDERTIMHRIVSVDDRNGITTAGDANAQHDPWTITRDDITGQARLLVPYVGLPGLWLQRGQIAPFAAWAVITTLAVLVAASALASGRRRVRPEGSSGRHAVDAPLVPVGAVLSVAVLAVSLAVMPSGTAEAAFTGSTRTSLAWKVAAYPAIQTGALAGYGAVAASSIQNTSGFFYQSRIDGNAATTPGTTVSGFWDSDIATVHLNDQAARNTMAAAQTARTALLAQPVTRTLAPSLTGTVTGGVYTSTTGSFSVPGTLVLDARGDASARFVFRTTGSLATAQRSRIVLANGAQAANVWWVVGTTATLGDAVAFGSPDTAAIGNHLVNGNVALRGTALAGRVVSYTGSVSLNGRITPPS